MKPEVSSIQVGGDHYKNKPLQPWDIIDALGLDFYEGNALKYLLRYQDKNGVEDLKKAIHYIDKIIDRENKKCPPSKQLDTSSKPAGTIWMVGKARLFMTRLLLRRAERS